MLKSARILIADDHTLFCELVASLLAEEFDVLGSTHDGPSAVAAAELLSPDVVILDIAMPLLNGIEVALRIRHQHPATRIVFLSMHDDATLVVRALRAGGSAYLTKSSAASELPRAIRAALRGQRYITASLVERVEELECYGDMIASLTSREREVVQLIAEGKPMKQAAVLLNVTTRTIAFHKYGVMKKLGLHSTADLVRLAVSEHIVAS